MMEKIWNYMVDKAVHCLFVSLSTHSLNHIECFASFSVSFYTNRFIDMQETSNILTLSANSPLAYQCSCQCFLLFYTNHSNEKFIYNLFCLFVDLCCLFNILIITSFHWLFFSVYWFLSVSYEVYFLNHIWLAFRDISLFSTLRCFPNHWLLHTTAIDLFYLVTLPVLLENCSLLGYWIYRCSFVSVDCTFFTLNDINIVTNAKRTSFKLFLGWQTKDGKLCSLQLYIIYRVIQNYTVISRDQII